MNDEKYVVQKAESTNDDDFSFVEVIAVGEPHCIRSCCLIDTKPF